MTDDDISIRVTKKPLPFVDVAVEVIRDKQISDASLGVLVRMLDGIEPDDPDSAEVAALETLGLIARTGPDEWTVNV